MVKIHLSMQEVSSMPGGRAKIPHALWPKKYKTNRNNIVTDSINNLNGPD